MNRKQGGVPQIIGHLMHPSFLNILSYPKLLMFDCELALILANKFFLFAQRMAYPLFKDLSVYRLTKNAYYQGLEKFVGDSVFRSGTPEEAARRDRDRQDPSSNVWFREHLETSYGGCWNYNEIIGYIQPHFLGSQVRGMYHAVNKQRIVRTRTKQFLFRTLKLAPEVEINFPYETSRCFNGS